MNKSRPRSDTHNHVNDSHASQSSNKPVSRNRIQEFVLETLNMLGAAVELVEWGVYDVLLSGVSEFQNSVRRITFDVEVAQERGDCELVMYGTPFLESLIQVAKDRGQVQVRRVHTRADPPSENLDRKLFELVQFVKCKPPKAVRWWTEEALILLCHLHVTFQADEVVEDMVSALVDTHSLADITHLLQLLQTHWFESGSPQMQTAVPSTASTPATGAVDDNDRARMSGVATNGLAAGAAGDSGGSGAAGDSGGSGGVQVSQPLRISSPFSMDEVLDHAVAAVQPKIQRKIEQIASENRQQLRDELNTSQRYYETTLKTLNRQLQNAMDGARRDRIKQKIEATKQDKVHRLEDISRAYDVSAELSLDQAILYRVPVVCIESEVQQRLDIHPFVFRYYPFASSFAPITCPMCRKTVTKLERKSESWHCGCQA